MSHEGLGSTSGRSTAVIHVGTPPPNFEDWAQTKVNIHGFADLSTERGRGNCVDSPFFWCLGYQWNLEIFPGGFRENDESEDLVSVRLVSYSDAINSQVQYGFIIAGFEDKFDTFYGGEWDWSKNAEDFDRNTLLEHLVNGALVVEIRMRPTKYPAPFIPANPATHSTLYNLYMKREFADVVFEVNGARENNDEADNQDSSPPALTSKFYAHKLILREAAPLLVELSTTTTTTPAATSNESPLSHVEIPDISPPAFEALLQYIYGHETPNFGGDVSLTKEIIMAADKYAIVNLKLEAEAGYVSTMELTANNVLENLQFAHRMNCFLLKEEVMDFIVANPAELLEKETLKDAPEGFFTDVLAAMARREEARDSTDGGKKRKSAPNDAFSTMHISELRRRAYDMGEEVDGSRAVLIDSIR